MSKKPDAETELRVIRSQLRRVLEALTVSNQDRKMLCGQVTKALQDAAEWKRRFDDLLARVPLKQIE